MAVFGYTRCCGLQIFLYFDASSTSLFWVFITGVKYTIYSDPEKKNILDIKEYTLEEAVNITISVDDYLDKAATITHKIKLDKNTNNYYFVSSVIE